MYNAYEHETLRGMIRIALGFDRYETRASASRNQFHANHPKVVRQWELLARSGLARCAFAHSGGGSGEYQVTFVGAQLALDPGEVANRELFFSRP